MMKKILASTLPLVLLAAAGCGRGNLQSVEAANGPAEQAAPAGGGRAQQEAARAVVLASGTAMRVRLAQTLDTKRNRAGDRFSATLDEPLVIGDRVVVPRGTPFAGHVVSSAESGRFKGRATLALSLDSFELDGATYPVRTTTPTRVSARHRKHNWLWIGGGSGAGAAIGAIASGGTGALIGAGAGAAAGTVGAAFTGKREVTIPVESRISFTLQSPVSIRG
jgi:hypothetical protein